MTREGRRFGLALLLVGAAAYNTGNNLIFLVFALMLSLLLSSYLLAVINLRGLECRIAADRPLVAGENGCCKITMRTTQRCNSSYVLAVAIPDCGGQRLPVRLPVVQRREAVVMPIDAVIDRRGYWTELPVEVASGFPFGLFRQTMRISAQADLLVYPRAAVVDDAIIGSLRGGFSHGKPTVGGGDELHALREYRHGDDPRRLHWKASARAAALIIREFEEFESPRVTVVVDNLIPDGLAGDPAPVFDTDSFERAVSLAAGLAGRLLSDGYLVRLAASGVQMHFGRGEVHLHAILRSLATLQLKTEWEGPVSLGDGPSVCILQRRGSTLAVASAASVVVVYADGI